MWNYSPGLSGAPLWCQLWRTTWQAPLPHALRQMFLVALPQGILWPSHTPLARICVRLGCGGEVQQCPSLSSGRALRRSVGALKLLKFYYSFRTSPSWLQSTISVLWLLFGDLLCFVRGLLFCLQHLQQKHYHLTKSDLFFVDAPECQSLLWSGSHSSQTGGDRLLF